MSSETKTIAATKEEEEEKTKQKQSTTHKIPHK